MLPYHRSEHVFKKRADGSFEKVVVRKRPGTEAICAAIMNKYNVDTVPHIICGGFSLQDTEDALLTLSYLGIDNVLVLRGDAAKNESAFEPEPGGHKFASDLLKQVTNLNAGVYLEDELKGTHKTGFCIGVAGYPEKHFEAPNMDSDLNYLKKSRCRCRLYRDPDVLRQCQIPCICKSLPRSRYPGSHYSGDETHYFQKAADGAAQDLSY